MNPLIETLNRFGDRFLSLAGPMLLQSSIVIALLFALDWLLRERVRAVVRHAVWMLALVKLLLPTSLALPTSPAYWLRQQTAPPAPPPVVVTRAYAPPPAAQSFQLPANFTRAEIASVIPPAPRLTAAGTVGLAVALGALALLTVLVRRARAVRRLIHQSAPPSATEPVPLEELLGICAREMGVRRRIGIRLSDAVPGPALCGLFRPVILMPERVAENLSDSQLRAVLLHELAHFQRGDLWINHLQTLLQIVYWWHPLLWLANARIRQVREEAVDETVLVALRDESETYPETLLNVAKLSLPRPRFAIGLVGIVECRSTLGQRIRRMLTRPLPHNARVGLVGVAIVIAAGAVLLPMARAAKEAEKPGSSTNTQPASTSYKGKSVKGWFDQYDLNGNTTSSNQVVALEAIRQFGTNALPFLRERLTVPLEGKRFPMSGDNPHAKAAWILSHLATTAEGVLPDLILALNDVDPVVFYAAAAIGNIGPNARAAVPALFESLRSGNGPAGKALVAIAPDHPDLVPTLIEVLKNGDDQDPGQVRINAAMALGSLGRKAAAAIPILRGALQDKEIQIRLYAGQALRRIASDRSDVMAEVEAVQQQAIPKLPPIPELIEKSKDFANDAGWRAMGDLAFALSKARTEGSPVPREVIRDQILPLVDKALDEKDGLFSNAACAVCRALGKDAEPLLPKVLLIAENDKLTRLSAIGSLGGMAPGDPRTLPVLIRALDDVIPHIRQNAAAGLQMFGPDAGAAVPGLQRLLKDRDQNVRFNASFALWNIARQPPSIPQLVQHLNEDESGDYVPLALCKLFREMGPAAKEAVPALRELLSHWDPKVRKEARAALEKVSPGGPALKPQRPNAGSPQAQATNPPQMLTRVYKIDRERFEAALRVRFLGPTTSATATNFSTMLRESLISAGVPLDQPKPNAGVAAESTPQTAQRTMFYSDAGGLLLRLPEDEMKLADQMIAALNTQTKPINLAESALKPILRLPRVTDATLIVDELTEILSRLPKDPKPVASLALRAVEEYYNARLDSGAIDLVWLKKHWTPLMAAIDGAAGEIPAAEKLALDRLGQLVADTTSAVERIRWKLAAIELQNVQYDRVRLADVVRDLREQGRKRDPDKSGFGFVLSPTDFHADAPTKPQFNLNDALVTVPRQERITVARLLNEIVKGCEHPIHYSIGDTGGVWFYPRSAAQAENKASAVILRPSLNGAYAAPEPISKEARVSYYRLHSDDLEVLLSPKADELLAGVLKAMEQEPPEIRETWFRGLKAAERPDGRRIAVTPESLKQVWQSVLDSLNQGEPVKSATTDALVKVTAQLAGQGANLKRAGDAKAKELAAAGGGILDATPPPSRGTLQGQSKPDPWVYLGNLDARLSIKVNKLLVAVMEAMKAEPPALREKWLRSLNNAELPANNNGVTPESLKRVWQSVPIDVRSAWEFKQETLEELLKVSGQLPSMEEKGKITNEAVAFKEADPNDKPLFTRAFKVNPAVFLKAVQSAIGEPEVAMDNSDDVLRWQQELLWKFFAMAGVKFSKQAVRTRGLSDGPVPERIVGEDFKAIFYNNRIGLIFARATLAELDIMDHAIQALDTNPGKIELQLNYAEISEAHYKLRGFDRLVGKPQIAAPFDKPGAKPEASRQAGTTDSPAEQTGSVLESATLADAQFRMFYRMLEQSEELKSLPSATTTLGGQTHFQVRTMETPEGTKTSMPAMMIDVIPDLGTREPGKEEIRLVTLITINEFIGYDDPKPSALPDLSLTDPPKPITASLPLPRFRVHQSRLETNLMTGRTLMLVGPEAKSSSATGSGRRTLVFITPKVVTPDPAASGKSK
jgi:beta-lactamase regulating signal transducer with metallopeptidase domain/HEAT repeat protein